MTHEPECIYVEGVSHWIRYDGECGFCFIARLAYQRGREDAAEAVRLASIDVYGIPGLGPHILDEDDYAIIAAARGNACPDCGYPERDKHGCFAARGDGER